MLRVQNRKNDDVSEWKLAYSVKMGGRFVLTIKSKSNYKTKTHQTLTKRNIANIKKNVNHKKDMQNIYDITIQ